MQPLDPDAASLLREWIEKADADLEVARRMAAEAADNLRIRKIVGFHYQQAAEKYLKALLTRCQIEFPKTHDIKMLLQLAGDPPADFLRGAQWLSPFGVAIRYPGDSADMLPGDGPGQDDRQTQRRERRAAPALSIARRRLCSRVYQARYFSRWHGVGRQGDRARYSDTAHGRGCSLRARHRARAGGRVSEGWDKIRRAPGVGASLAGDVSRFSDLLPQKRYFSAN